MARKNPLRIPDVEYKALSGQDLGVECITLASLYDRFPFFSPNHVDASSAPVFKARARVAQSCDVLMNEIMLAANSSSSALVIRLLVAALILKAFDERPDDPPG